MVKMSLLHTQVIEFKTSHDDLIIELTADRANSKSIVFNWTFTEGEDYTFSLHDAAVPTESYNKRFKIPHDGYLDHEGTLTIEYWS